MQTLKKPILEQCLRETRVEDGAEAQAGTLKRSTPTLTLCMQCKPLENLILEQFPGEARVEDGAEAQAARVGRVPRGVSGPAEIRRPQGRRLGIEGSLNVRSLTVFSLRLHCIEIACVSS